jgi:tetratricopeptide (TPR) repeat protein
MSQQAEKERFTTLISQAQALWNDKKLGQSDLAFKAALAVICEHEELLADCVDAAVSFADQQALYGYYEPAGQKFDTIIKLVDAAKSVPPGVAGRARSKAGSNEFNCGNDIEAIKHFDEAVKLFETDPNCNDAEFADCLNLFGRALEKTRNFSKAFAVQEKAFHIYTRLNDQHRLQALRADILQTIRLTKGAQKEPLEIKACALLGLAYHPPSLTFKQCLKALQKEGFAQELSTKTIKKLVPDLDHEDDGPAALLEVLRKYHESNSGRGNDLLIYEEPLDIAQANAIFDDLSKRLSQDRMFEVIAWDGQLSPMTVATTDGERRTLTYSSLADLVSPVNEKLEAAGDQRRFYALDDVFEDEAIFLLTSIAARNRLQRALPFVDE